MPKLHESVRGRVPKPQVETFHAGQARNWFSDALPGPVTGLFCLVMAGSIVGLAYYLGDRFGDGRGSTWAFVVIAVMTALVGGAAILAGWQQRRAARENPQAFHGVVRKSALGLDTSEAGNERVAAVDVLRQKFQAGIDVFDRHQKDLYELPWYVMIGGTSAGKTHAIRHSGLRMPPDLQNKLQGTGGTLDMDWWFTNSAVLLDTAGALLEKPSQAERFEKFLALLREYRTDFPINGVIVALPVPALLADPPDLAQDKAARLAKQLRIVQKALDVRFPLYVMISMSDRLPGFREFCDAEGQSDFEMQMIGWSNPEPLSAEFDPAIVGEALERVGERLHGRALALLADPVVRDESRSRLDEVDALYSLSQTIRALEPGLRCYLDALFPVGPWAAKAAFFRGFYFTSALREGGQIDTALAEAMNVEVGEVIPGGDYTENKAFFLRDFFLNKVFPERGLVTRLRDVSGMLRRRLVMFYGTVFFVLATILLLTLWVREHLTRQLDDEQGQWFHANATWNNGTLLSPLARQSAGSRIPPRWLWIAGDDRLAQLQKILDFSSRRLDYAWAFTPVSEWRDFEARRRKARLRIFEASVMKGLLDAAREHLRWDAAPGAQRDAAGEERLIAAYQQLVRLEDWCSPPGGGNAAPAIEPKEWQEFFAALLAYVLDTPRDDALAAKAAQMATLATKVYGRGDQLHERSWLAENEPNAKDSALCLTAAHLFSTTASTALDTQKRRELLAQRDHDLLEGFNAARKRVLDWSREPSEHARDQVTAGCVRPMREAIEAHRQLLIDDRGSAHPAAKFELIVAAAHTTVEALDHLDSEVPLQAFRPAAEQLAGRSREAAQAKSDGNEAAWTHCRQQFEEYEKAFAERSPEQLPIQFLNMVGNLKVSLEYAIELTKPGEPPVHGNSDSDLEDQKIDRFLMSYRGTSLIGAVFTKYEQKDLSAYLSAHLKFPLVNTPRIADRNLTELRQDCEALNLVQTDAKDLKALTNPQFKVPEREHLQALFDRLRDVFKVKEALYASGGTTDRPDGLSIEIDGVTAAGTRTETTNENVSSGPFNLLHQNVPKTTTVQLDGVMGISIDAGGPHTNSGLDGKPTVVPYDGYSAVQIDVSLSQTNSANNPIIHFHSPEGWELLQKVMNGKKRFMLVEKPPIGFILRSNPPLPVGHWPKRNDFVAD